MAKECGCTYDDVTSVLKSLNLTPDSYIKTKRYYGQLKEDLIYKTLYFIGKCQMVTFESKINNKNFDDELFLEHKRNTYLKSL